MQQNSYKLVDVIQRHNSSTDKDYYIAYVLYKNKYDYALLKVYVDEKTADKLLDVIDDSEFDLTTYMSVEYNTFSNKYQPVINY